MGLRTAALAALLVTACSAPATDRSSSPATPADAPSTTSAAPERTLDQRAADAEADAATYDGIVTGISVALVQEGELRTVIHGPAVDDPDQRFMVASVSKPMVAAGVLSLVASGDLGLEDTLGQLVPGRLPRAARVTVEQLLSMSSGLADYGEQPWYVPFRFTSQQLVDRLAELPLEFRPGAQGDYNNSNFAVLDVVAQEVTGGTLADLLDRAVFEPAGMRAASLGDRPDVPGTTTEDRPYRPQMHAPSAGGGVVAAAADVARFLEALTRGELLPPDLVEDMESDHAHTDIGVYGLGLVREETACGVAFGHEGNNDGFEAAAWTLPEVHRTAVVLVNAADVGAARSIALRALCDD